MSSKVVAPVILTVPGGHDHALRWEVLYFAAAQILTRHRAMPVDRSMECRRDGTPWKGTHERNT